jgi:hypothetical protein
MGSWSRVLIAGTAVVSIASAGFAAEASAGLPHARPPGSTALRDLGVKLDWPLHRDLTTVKPGQRITVTVKRAGAATPRLVLVRTDATGTPRRAIMGDQGRRGRLTVTVPKRADEQYQLRLQIGRETFWSWVQTPAAAQPEPAPAPVAPTPEAASPIPSAAPAAPVAPEPVPAPGVPGGPPVYNHPGLPCAASGGTPAATSTISATSGRVGDTVRLTMTNTGNICLYDDLDTHFERKQPDGTWQTIAEPPYSSTDVPERSLRDNRTDTTIGMIGDTWTTEIRVWSTLQPGHYRLVKNLRTVANPYPMTYEYDILT